MLLKHTWFLLLEAMLNQALPSGHELHTLYLSHRSCSHLTVLCLSFFAHISLSYFFSSFSSSSCISTSQITEKLRMSHCIFFLLFYVLTVILWTTGTSNPQVEEICNTWGAAFILEVYFTRSTCSFILNIWECLISLTEQNNFL